MSSASDDEAVAALMMEAGSSSPQRRRPSDEVESASELEHEHEHDDPEEQSAFPIGAGRAHFLFTVDIVAWGGDGHGLQLPEPGAGGMWLSYILFKSVACTDRFYELGGPNDASDDEGASPQAAAGTEHGRHRRSTDMFRLRSRADGADLAAWFAGTPVGAGAGAEGGGDPNRRWLQIFLCAPQRFVAVARLDLWQLLMEGRRPGQVGRAFFPHEAIGRFEMEAWEEDGPSGVAGGAWVDVRLRIEREEGDVNVDVDPLEEEAGSSERITLGDVTIPIGPPPLDDDEEEEGDSEEEDEEMGGVSGPGRRQRRRRRAAPRREVEEDDEETRRPGGLRAFRLSMDLRAVRGLPRAQRLFLYHHYPHLSAADPRVALGGSAALASAGSASVGPGPVVTEPVWVPARGEGPMRKGCCSFSFRGTYDLLGEAAAAHPFRVAAKALTGEGGGSVEVGQAVLPLSELLEDAPVTYRSAVKPKLFRSYGACQRYLDRVGGGRGRPQASPIIMRVLDTYVPVVLRDAAGGGSGGGQAALRAVLVLEDLGPAAEGDDEGSESQDLEAAAASAASAASVSSEARVPSLTSFMSSSAASVGPFVPSQAQSQGPPGQGEGAAAPAGAGAGAYPELSVALTLLDVERKKLEFEDWRHKREVEWSDRLRAKEAQRMEQLERAYEAREAERKARFQQVQEELARLEAQLRRSLSEVEARERRLATEEAALEQQAAKQADEAQALQRRLREEARYQVERDRRRAAEQDERAARLTRQVELAERKALEAQEEFARYRREQRKQTPQALQAEVVKLTKEKAELEARCERERAERTQAQLEKEQYRAALQRTARALKREQARKLGDLRGQLEQLRLEYMARDERYRSCGDREELHAIKRTLDALRHFGGGPGKGGAAGAGAGAVGGLSANSRKQPLQQQPVAAAAGAGATQQQEGKENAGGFVPMPPPPQTGGRGAGPRRRGLFTVLTEQDEDDQATLPNPRGVLGSEAAAEEVTRLRREREMLLSSGNYDVDDPIIQELSKLIRERGGAGDGGGGGGGGVPGGVVSQASTITFSGEQEAAVGSASGGAVGPVGAAASGASVSS